MHSTKQSTNNNNNNNNMIITTATDKSDNPFFIYDTITLPSPTMDGDGGGGGGGKSPYSKRYPPNFIKIPELEYQQLQQQQQKQQLNGDTTISIFNFETPNGSPYSRRYPANEKRRLRSVDDYETIDKHPINWTPTSSEEEFEIVQDMVLPVEMTRFHSMHSLRSRRDPVFQGNRSRKAKRVIDKAGERNIEYTNIPQRSARFLKDFVTTLIDEQWRYVIIVFALSFIVCWFFFAILWYLIAHSHGDLNFDPVTGEVLHEGKVVCVERATSFIGFLLFSIETQVSIGYGDKYPNEDCPEAIFLMVVQIVVGIAIEGAMVSIVYAKMIRPPKHSSELKFSKKAVICQRDSKLCLIFRLCDSRLNHCIESKIQAYWFEERFSLEGEKLRQFQYSLKLDNPSVFLLSPVTVCHVIDCNSPLYDLSGKDLLEKRFEIIVTLTGSSRSTAQMTQSRTSYLPKEILWGHRFVNVMSYDKSKDTYVADYDKFEETIVIDTPLCSARRLEEVIDEVHEILNTDMIIPSDHTIIHDDYSQDELYSTDEKLQIGDIIIEPIRPQHRDNISVVTGTGNDDREYIQNAINENSESEKEQKKLFRKELEKKLSESLDNLNEIRSLNDSLTPVNVKILKKK